jgi:hypothetical protein
MNICVLNEMKSKLSLPINSESQNDQKVDDTTYYKQMKRITLNVGGVRHEVLLKNLEKYPKSRLGKIRFAKSLDEIKELCDDMNGDELFFDRSFNSFETILDFYRIENPRNYSDAFFSQLKKVQDDLFYWGLAEFILEDDYEDEDDEKDFNKSVSQISVKPKSENAHDMITEEENIFSSAHSIFEHKMNRKLSNTFSRKDTIWLLMEYPNSSTWSARVSNFTY